MGREREPMNISYKLPKAFYVMMMVFFIVLILVISVWVSFEIPEENIVVLGVIAILSGVMFISTIVTYLRSRVFLVVGTTTIKIKGLLFTRKKIMKDHIIQIWLITIDKSHLTKVDKVIPDKLIIVNQTSGFNVDDLQSVLFPGKTTTTDLRFPYKEQIISLFEKNGYKCATKQLTFESQEAYNEMITHVRYPHLKK